MAARVTAWNWSVSLRTEGGLGIRIFSEEPAGEVSDFLVLRIHQEGRFGKENCTFLRVFGGGNIRGITRRVFGGDLIKGSARSQGEDLIEERIAALNGRFEFACLGSDEGSQQPFPVYTLVYVMGLTECIVIGEELI